MSKELELKEVKLNDEKQLMECWNYTNLRPLWWYENLTRPKNGTDIKNK